MLMDCENECIRSTFIFLLTNSQNVQLNRFDTRICKVRMLTGPIVNERKILLLYGGKHRTIIYHHTVRRNTHKKLVLSFVVLMAEMAKKQCQSCMSQVNSGRGTDRQTDGSYQEHYLPASLSNPVDNQFGVSFDCQD